MDGPLCLLSIVLVSQVQLQDPIVDMIFEWLVFLLEVQTEKNRKSMYHKKPKKSWATANFKFGTAFSVFQVSFSVFLGCNLPILFGPM